MEYEVTMRQLERMMSDVDRVTSRLIANSCHIEGIRDTTYLYDYILNEPLIRALVSSDNNETLEVYLKLINEEGRLLNESESLSLVFQLLRYAVYSGVGYTASCNNLFTIGQCDTDEYSRRLLESFAERIQQVLKNVWNEIDDHNMPGIIIKLNHNFLQERSGISP